MLTGIGCLQIAFFLLLLLLLVPPLGFYMVQIYERKWFRSTFVERFLYRLARIQPHQDMNWKAYLTAMLLFNLLGVLAVYALQRLQGLLPLNPQAFPSVPADLSFNTAISFVTNSNWQAYSGETTLSYLTQMLALTSQNFLSAATGLALLFAVIRGITRHETNGLGNFWVDLVRGTLYLLLPLACLLALTLVSQGVIQTLQANQKVNLMQSLSYLKPVEGAPRISEIITEQTIPMGPVASQVAIKQLGSNGGGFFNANSAHPFENPTPVTDFLELLAIVLIPAALCYSFGLMVKDKRQGFSLLAVMLIIFIPAVISLVALEQQGNPAFVPWGVDLSSRAGSYPGGNMEGKETRFGIVGSGLWAVASTATSNGSTNAMYDSFMPLGGAIPLWMMHLGEVIFGGVGSGLYNMLLFLILTVFLAGLMVGRTPEYLGKKIEPYEMKMASIAVLLIPLIVLMSTALAATTVQGVAAISNPEAHGLTEILYAFTSMTVNNGSAFAGLNSNSFFYNLLGGLVMLVGRYGMAIPALALAGALARKKVIPSTVGTLGTHTPTFMLLLLSVILLLGALSFFPVLALGPVTEQLMLWGQYGH